MLLCELSVLPLNPTYTLLILLLLLQVQGLFSFALAIQLLNLVLKWGEATHEAS